MVLNLMVLN